MQNKIIGLNELKTFLNNIKTYIASSLQTKQDVLLSGNNIKTINEESILGSGDINIKNCIDITYSDLVALRNNNDLVPGRQYRIIDYLTTTNGNENSVSMNHRFDLIVTALSSNSLSENAHACRVKILDHEYNHDTKNPYFANDIEVSDWTNVAAADIPQDIKDLGFQFNADGDVKTLLVDSYNSSSITYNAGDIRVVLKWKRGSHRFTILGVELIKADDETVVSNDYHIGYAGTAHTNNIYSLIAPENGTYKIRLYIDAKTEAVDSTCVVSGYRLYDYFENNDLNAWQVKYVLDNEYSRYRWANSNGKGVIYYLKDEFCNEATYDFKNIAYNINNTKYYTFSYIVNNEIYDGSIRHGNCCHHNKVGPDMVVAASGSFKGLSKIYFKNTSSTAECNNNIIENNCWSITFGSNCHGNKIGVECEQINFGNDCSYIDIDTHTKNVTLGDNINTIKVGKNCTNIRLLDSSNNNANNCRQIVFGDYCTNTNIKTSTQTSDNNFLQNIYVTNSISGTIEVSKLNDPRVKHVTKNENNEIIQYYESDAYNKESENNYKPVVETADDTINMEPNKYYKKTNVSSNITINLNAGDNTIVNEYFIEFTTSDSGTTVSLPADIKWANGEIPVFENSMTYQLSIINSLGVCAKFA